ncbi:MAG: TetR/AcrR family transcriptional regulator [Nitrospiraceae bacterium]|nr:TetR/AcrR family transcriptional regulator [Nitrospiraceae bacterium]
MDRRIGRTRKLMQEALMSLITEKGYEAITVQDILDRADVGRSTFYAHYRDKDELLFSGFEHLRGLFEQQQRSLGAAQQGEHGADFNMILELFRHTGQNHKLYKAIAGKQSGEMILKYLHRYLYDMMIVPHKALVKSKKTAVPIEVATHWIVSSLLSLMIWWLENNMPFPPERMDEMFRQLTMPGMEAALGRKVQKRDIDKAAIVKKDSGAKAFYSMFVDQEGRPEGS